MAASESILTYQSKHTITSHTYTHALTRSTTILEFQSSSKTATWPLWPRVKTNTNCWRQERQPFSNETNYKYSLRHRHHNLSVKTDNQHQLCIEAVV